MLLNAYFPLSFIFFKSTSTLVCMACSAQEKADYTPEDRAIFDTYVQAMQGKEHLPLGDLLVETAKFFKDRPYVNSTLEKEPERLVINLRELDCTTLVESVLALARTVKADNPSFEAYAGQLKQLRYRQGEIHDYTDRLHYFSDWIHENRRKGIDMIQIIFRRFTWANARYETTVFFQIRPHFPQMAGVGALHEQVGQAFEIEKIHGQGLLARGGRPCRSRLCFFQGRRCNLARTPNSYERFRRKFSKSKI